MKRLIEYIYESIKPLENNTHGLIVFDIDDTILKTNSKDMKIYKHPNGDKSKEIGLSTDEYAKDPDAGDPNKKHWFDYRDFRDEKKIINSIINGTPIIRNLRILDNYLKAGYDFSFLTARGCEDVIKKALGQFLRTKNDNGNLVLLGKMYKRTLSHAVNDDSKYYPGSTDAEKKANVLRGLCKKYDVVVFVDDDKKNIKSAKDLKIPNLKVIKAWQN